MRHGDSGQLGAALTRVRRPARRCPAGVGVHESFQRDSVCRVIQCVCVCVLVGCYVFVILVNFMWCWFRPLVDDKGEYDAFLDTYSIPFSKLVFPEPFRLCSESVMCW